MPKTTPPKGRATAGRRDRQVARQRSRSRRTTKRFIWGIVALIVLLTLLVIGTGTGSTVTSSNLVLPIPLLLFKRPGWDLDGARARRPRP